MAGDDSVNAPSPAAQTLPIVNRQYDAVLSNPQFLANGIPGSRYAVQPLAVDFTGVGPTAMVEVRRPMFAVLALYGNARGTLIYGRNEQIARFTNTVTNLNTRVPTTTTGFGTFSYRRHPARHGVGDRRGMDAGTGRRPGEPPGRPGGTDLA
jgi:hypothetical protein